MALNFVVVDTVSVNLQVPDAVVVTRVEFAVIEHDPLARHVFLPVELVETMLVSAVFEEGARLVTFHVTVGVPFAARALPAVIVNERAAIAAAVVSLVRWWRRMEFPRFCRSPQ